MSSFVFRISKSTMQTGLLCTPWAGRALVCWLRSQLGGLRLTPGGSEDWLLLRKSGLGLENTSPERFVGFLFLFYFVSVFVLEQGLAM